MSQRVTEQLSLADVDVVALEPGNQTDQSCLMKALSDVAAAPAQPAQTPPS